MMFFVIFHLPLVLCRLLASAELHPLHHYNNHVIIITSRTGLSE